MRTGHPTIDGPMEAEAMRADGTTFPIELIVTRPEIPGAPLFCGYLRDVTEAHTRERELRRLLEEQAALRRVATAVAAESDPAHAFAVVTEELARLLRAQTGTLMRFDEDRAVAVGAYNAEGVRGVPLGTRMRFRGDTAAGVIYQTRRADPRGRLRRDRQ